MEEKNAIQIALEQFSCRHPEVNMEKSSVSSQDIREIESRLNITIPNAVKNYFLSYTLSVPFITGKMLGDFSYTYCEETNKWREMEIEEEIATTTLQLPLMFPNLDLSDFEESNRIFVGTGFLHLGIYNESDYVLLDLQSEQVYRVDMERVRPSLREETRTDILRWAIPFFQNFEDLARCFFVGDLYDEDELTFDVE